MDIHEIYRSKLCTPDEAARLVPSDSHVAMGMAVAEPPALLAALARRIEAGDLSGMRLWYFHSMAHAAQSVLKRELLGKVRPHCMFLSGVERALVKADPAAAEALIDFVPTAFSASPQVLREEIALDTCVTMVSPMGKHGYFTFGTANDYTGAAAKAAKRLIVEVNPLMPRVFGESPLHVSEVDAIVEHRSPLLEVAEHAASAEDERIAEIIAEMIDDGACLQMGIGNLPAAVCRRLANRKNLGIHTELLTPALASLMNCGAANNRRKTTFPGRGVFTFAMGDTAFYEWLDDNQAVYSLPVDVVNDPRHIAKNDHVVSVNATLQVDLSGACNSEHMLGHQYSGSGGQLDFVRGANASKGGISIIACHSTAKNGTVSRIVPQLDGPVTTPRNDVHWIVTEHGAACLRGKTLRERADAMIALAHPKFRDELARAV
ncbi:acetyl-CoA hydrolase/transferase family protein [Novosphingobium album (ex Liu et al. 2023)]|uniref:Acetyl-CoA hydrolase/transferase C-terminal domain-containing protein n=1 Tax=Novosphingobium album (ex Liu et al. 2023) TaxID=3031130 RepID=A0ABT5WVU5_9SPHN|nr:acetyl-CoA hydrolase/transferase C-terminal domain-containing protein [Novosphingobium album (ex Liu et al. 2023)]MDE8653969.1 acetyl-CoA hydrolase/transferase C-terminal domain-containing protein [Novosphingobium album (ex Liu et al. 2023)]